MFILTTLVHRAGHEWHISPKLYTDICLLAGLVTGQAILVVPVTELGSDMLMLLQASPVPRLQHPRRY